MKLELQQLIALGVLSATIHWLFARSKVMQWLWAPARGWAARLLECPACAGFWIGLGLGTLGLQPLAVDVAGTPGELGYEAAARLAAGLLAMFATPVCEAVLLWGLEVAAIPQAVEPEISVPSVSAAAEAPPPPPPPPPVPPGARRKGPGHEPPTPPAEPSAAMLAAERREGKKR